jgi:hypothetical protein
MGYFSNVQEQIVELFEDGWSPLEVARMLKIDFADVNYVVHNYLNDDSYDYDDSMDGDFDSAMTSAGYGMDEDYVEGEYL